MRAKLTRVPEGVALILDEAVLQQLGWADDMEVDLEKSGDSVVITASPERDRKFSESAEKIAEQYEDVFRRLADS